MEVLKVSSKSNPNSVAGALAGVVRHEGAVEVQVVGAGALNQAIKAVAIARGYVVASGVDLICIPTFADIEIDGESRTAIRLLVEDRARTATPMAAPIGLPRAERIPVGITVDVRDDAVGGPGGTERVVAAALANGRGPDGR